MQACDLEINGYWCDSCEEQHDTKQKVVECGGASEPEVLYQCPNCGETFEDQDTAKFCCQDRDLANLKEEDVEPVFRCPHCSEDYFSKECGSVEQAQIQAFACCPENAEQGLTDEEIEELQKRRAEEAEKERIEYEQRRVLARLGVDIGVDLLGDE